MMWRKEDEEPLYTVELEWNRRQFSVSKDIYTAVKKPKTYCNDEPPLL